MDTQLCVYGIRHHGPGSARRLQRALREQAPDRILVEAPLEVEASFYAVGSKDLQAPVALLVYDTKDFKRSSYLPFAEFSPEWQAILYGNQQDIPVEAIDLPISMQLQIADEQQRILTFTARSKRERLLQYDPMYVLAELAGYSDSERWWEAIFEQEESDLAVFEAAIDMVRTLRESEGREEQRETLIREAHMRNCIRRAFRDGAQNVAVICGAWHAPVLTDLEAFPSRADNALLKGLKKKKLAVSWIPWSYERLARSSGYGAGVVSPAWYDLLYRQRKDALIKWMIRVAQILRKQDYDASSAHVMEAIRLAGTLATMRAKAIPDLEDMREAVITVFNEGREAGYERIRQRLVIGDKVGKVAPELSGIPLQKDLMTCIKSARLTREFNSSETITKELDLRKPANLLASHLLHRLQILGIPWGEERRQRESSEGSFREKWRLKWRPTYMLRLIEMSMWGNTMAEATERFVTQQIEEAGDLDRLLELLGEVLKADLDTTIDPLVQKIQNLSKVITDVLQLALALPPLVNILRYGSTRKLDRQTIGQLVEQLVPRICIGMPGVTVQLEDEAARPVYEHMAQTHSTITLLGSQQYLQQWHQALHKIKQDDQAHPLLRGLAVRLLTDQAQITIDESASLLSLALSPHLAAEQTAHWLEGFLHGSGLLLIHQPELWKILDQWVEALSLVRLEEMLPLLRRAFTKFSHAEREALLRMARQKPNSHSDLELVELSKERMALVQPLLDTILSD